MGSINLDFRSLYLHFECGTYLYRNSTVADVEKDFENTLEKCIPVTLKDCAQYNCRDQGRKIFKIDCTSHVTSPKEKQAPPQGGICFSWAINEGPSCDYF